MPPDTRDAARPAPPLPLRARGRASGPPPAPRPTLAAVVLATTYAALLVSVPLAVLVALGLLPLL